MILEQKHVRVILAIYKSGVMPNLRPHNEEEEEEEDNTTQYSTAQHSTAQDTARRGGTLGLSFS